MKLQGLMANLDTLPRYASLVTKTCCELEREHNQTDRLHLTTCLPSQAIIRSIRSLLARVGGPKRIKRFHACYSQGMELQDKWKSHVQPKRYKVHQACALSEQSSSISSTTGYQQTNYGSVHYC